MTIFVKGIGDFMTREEQKAYVSELLETVKNRINKLIDNETIPERWEGMELRQYVKDSIYQVGEMTKSQRREYNNDLLVNPL